MAVAHRSRAETRAIRAPEPANPLAQAVDLQAWAAEVLNGHPAVGLAVGVVRNGHLEAFCGVGHADIEAKRPVTDDTVFEIASITKTMTAIALMQLWEQGEIDLDAPANDYLRAYQLVPARRRFGPVTLRHLLTHTAGIRELLRVSGLLHLRDLGEDAKPGRRVPSLAEYYHGALRYDAEPGTRWMYTNHGFATLGQIVEDVTGMPYARYLRDRIFEPLGMEHSDVFRSERVAPQLATGYELRARGAERLPDLDLIPVPGGGVFSSTRDMAAYAAALLGGGANEHGRVLQPGTLASMFEPHYQPDPRIAGMGLAFFRANLGGHLVVEHDGIRPGFDSQLLVAPDDGVGVIAFANGAKRGMHWLGPHVDRLMRRLLSVANDGIRLDIPQHPETWSDLCGWYSFSSHPTDPARLAIGAGVEVFVRRGQLMLRFLSLIPALSRGFALHPDDGEDRHAFRVEFPWFGVGTTRVLFAGVPSNDTAMLYIETGSMSFKKERALTNPRQLSAGVLAALAAVSVAGPGAGDTSEVCTGDH